MRARANVSSQAPEVRAATCSVYSGTKGRCTGGYIIHGHVSVNANAAVQRVVLDESMDWRDRLITINAVSPSGGAIGGIPPTVPYKCQPSNGASNLHQLAGELLLTTAGWDTTTNIETPGLNPPQNFAELRDLGTGNLSDKVTIYADYTDGKLIAQVKQGEIRGITFMIIASEQLGYQSTVP